MKSILCSAIILCSFALACRQKQMPYNPHQPASFFAYFKPIAIKDTLHLEVATNSDDSQPLTDTIPSAIFFASLDSAWIKDLENLATPDAAAVFSKGHFPITEGYEAYWVEVHQFWFRHQSLLVFDQQKNIFSDRQTVAEWYGGESGQLLTGSWLFDVDGDGYKDLVRREIEHSMKMDEQGEPLESKSERAEVLVFNHGKFVPSKSLDTVGLVKRFPIKSVW